MARELVTRSLDTTYRRDSAFSYTCHACRRCCHDKIIQLNPYEVARLAGNRGVSTTEFLDRYTERSGTVLRRTEGNGACVFLASEGCGVHPDRPLVCRLYPLGRRVTAEGEESFREVEPHPQTEGKYGSHGTVEEFLSRQGAGPFITAVDRYVDVVGRMTAVLARAVQMDTELRLDIERVTGQIASVETEMLSEWIDMDRTVSSYCARHDAPVPATLDGKVAVHIRAIDEWIESI